MNITNSSVYTFWTNTTSYTPTATTADFDGNALNLNALSSSSPVATVNSSDQERQQTWEIWEFWAVALPLVIGSIIIPLVADSIIRWVARTAYQNRTWWRVIMSFFAFG